VNQSRAFMTSLIVGLLGVLLVWAYIQQEQGKILDEFGDRVSVVIASQDINEMEIVSEAMLEVRNVPRKFVQPGSSILKEGMEKEKAFSAIVGKVALTPIQKGEQILSTKVVKPGAETGLSSQVAVTKRALAIPVNNVTGVTRLLKPGDRVDIVARIVYRTPDDKQDSEIKTVLQNIQVLSVGELIQNNSSSVADTDPVTGAMRFKNLRGDRDYDTVTIEVTPVEAQLLIYTIEETSQLYLTLRNPVDRLPANVSTVTVDEVLGENSKKIQREKAMRAIASPPPAPVRAPPPNPFVKGGGSLVK
jgi:pilus assembly protein CpaB